MEWIAPAETQGSKAVFVVVGWVVLFLLSGVATPMLITQIRFSYALPSSTLWPLYPLYLGNLMAGAFGPRVSRNEWWGASKLFALDAVGQAFTNWGLLLIGPPLYATFYKSVTLFTGLLSLCFLPPASHPNLRQWGAMVLITVGLAMQGFDAVETMGFSEVWGGGIVVFGCVFFAGGAVVSELLLGPMGGGGLGPLPAAWVVGTEGVIICIIWAACTVRSLPPGFGVWLLLLTMVLSNACHQAAWFNLVGCLGACATAVLKALVSVCIFFGASAAFCWQDKNECLTWEKVGSFCIVCTGVVIYSWPSAKRWRSFEDHEIEPLMVAGLAADASRDEGEMRVPRST